MIDWVRAGPCDGVFRTASMIFWISSPVDGLMSLCALPASARKGRSLMVASNARRSSQRKSREWVF